MTPATTTLVSRIIPAYAGSTATIVPICVIRAGSSPHTRGAPAPQPSSGPRCRIIPAYAGSTRERNKLMNTTTDHPRIRGEHTIDDRRRILTNGSSPHTRGARSKSSARRGRGRIIPAYAGSTYKVEGGKKLRPDHPRIRGEHLAVARSAAASPGSSPHTRGAHWVGHPDGGGAGIIPAYAGSTPCRGCRAVCTGDHPRIRGEHLVDPLPSGHDGGSSPHTRGARLRLVEIELAAGIIPAYAGSTSGRRGMERHGRDHPRIRGEHSRATIRPQTVQGSSPHTRGALRRYERLRAQFGIIPAYAGSTD